METIPRPSRRSSEVRRIRRGVGDLPCPRHRGPRSWGIEASDRQTRFSTLELTGVFEETALQSGCRGPTSWRTMHPL